MPIWSFLADPAAVLVNLVPDEAGVVVVPREGGLGARMR